MTGSNVPFVGYTLAIVGMIAAGLLLIRYSYLSRKRDAQHVQHVGHAGRVGHAQNKRAAR